jgi:hypothetical protein
MFILKQKRFKEEGRYKSGTFTGTTGSTRVLVVVPGARDPSTWYRGNINTTTTVDGTSGTTGSTCTPENRTLQGF